ncbi:anti-repressor SinI family protein [Cytobacillus eiseniae]|nr:anti-repressor SinI family protein [Cytobacillus eiseniae]
MKVRMEGIDIEWLQLILEAKNMGINKEEIKEFFTQNKVGND